MKPGPWHSRRLTHHEKRYVEEAPVFDLEKEADRVIWEQSRHAGLVVNGDLQILHFRGDTSPYLRPVPGKATFQLLRMLREELVIELRAAINKARKTKASVKREAVRVKRNGDFHLVNIEVRPLPAHRAGDQYFLILFEEVVIPPQRRTKSAVGRQPKEGSRSGANRGERMNSPELATTSRRSSRSRKLLTKD